MTEEAEFDRAMHSLRAALFKDDDKYFDEFCNSLEDRLLHGDALIYLMNTKNGYRGLRVGCKICGWYASTYFQEEHRLAHVGTIQSFGAVKVYR